MKNPFLQRKPIAKSISLTPVLTEQPKNEQPTPPFPVQTQPQNPSSNTFANHRHNFIDQGNYSACSCGKRKLILKNSAYENILEGIKSDGKKYTVRMDRHRYFFPSEWLKFANTLTNRKHYIFFLTLLHTGARAMEAMHLRPINFNTERGTITFEVVKQRKAKRQFQAIGKMRTFFVSDKYIREIKSYINKNNIRDTDYLFLDNKKLPPDYVNLPNKDKKKYYEKVKTTYNQLLKRKLRKAGIKDWRNFSLHNIRKTYGNWMRIYDIRMEEICYRLGHDMQTYFIHYGSPLIFTSQEKIEIMNILGKVK